MGGRGNPLEPDAVRHSWRNFPLAIVASEVRFCSDLRTRISFSFSRPSALSAEHCLVPQIQQRRVPEIHDRVPPAWNPDPATSVASPHHRYPIAPCGACRDARAAGACRSRSANCCRASIAPSLAWPHQVWQASQAKCRHSSKTCRATKCRVDQVSQPDRRVASSVKSLNTGFRPGGRGMALHSPLPARPPARLRSPSQRRPEGHALTGV